MGKAEDRAQKTEDGRQMANDRGFGIGNSEWGMRNEVGKQMTDDRWQKTDGRKRKT